MIAANANTPAAEPAARGGEQDEYVTLTVGEQMFGLPIERVHDVFMPSALTPVPLAPHEISGLLNLRGRVVTALCLRRRLGLPVREDGGRPMAVGLDHEGEAFGLLVDAVGEVLKLSRDDREPNPAHMDARWTKLSQGVHRLDQKLLIILDVGAVLALDVEARAA